MKKRDGNCPLFILHCLEAERDFDMKSTGKSWKEPRIMGLDKVHEVEIKTLSFGLKLYHLR